MVEKFCITMPTVEYYLASGGREDVYKVTLRQ